MQPGQTYAHYSIVAKLGAGGMGEVYRAHDTKLRRDVALKVLPAAFATDADRMVRFEQEARSLAALNHPNVSGIYGIEQHEDLRFLVMELAEGEDLSVRISRGALPASEVVDLARQIAAGLESAHVRGIVHRDLKPANIKVLPDGTVKILDFGLAKALVADPNQSAEVLANSPTILNTVTQPGVLLGTAAYMSPEQARGKPVDWRTDIWAFGCVLYEMLTGRQAYGRPTVTDMLAAIIERDPDFAALPDALPPALVQLLRRTLSKDLRNRLQSIGDARIVLQEIQDGTGEEFAAAGAPAARRRPLPWLAAIAAAVILTAAGTWWLGGRQPAAESAAAAPTLHLSLPLPDEYPLHYVGGSLLGTEFTALDLADDGTRLVYLSRSSAFSGLVVCDLTTGAFRALSGTENAYLPVFSPDGAWVAFLADGSLKRVPYAGGGVEALTSAFDATDLHWSRDGNLYWTDRQGQALKKMRPALGAPVEAVLDPCDCRQTTDWIVPGELLVQRADGYVRREPDGTEHPLEIRGGNVRRFGPDYALFTQSGRLMAAKIDPRGTDTVLTPRTALTGLRTTPLTGRGHFAVSQTGMLAYVAGAPADVANLVRRFPDGTEQPLPFEAGIYGSLDVSPDGSRIAIVVHDGTGDRRTEVLSIRTGTKQVVAKGYAGYSPLWSADGASLTLDTVIDSTFAIAEYAIDSTAPPTVLFTSPEKIVPFDWSADGSLLALTTRGESNIRLSVWDRATATLTQLAMVTEGSLWAAAFSPDARFVAYTQVGSAGSEVYVVPYPATGKRWLVSAGPGEEPLWREDRNELVFRRGQGWYSVAFTTDGGEFQAAAPELMFEGPYINIGGMEYRLLADGSLILLESANTQQTADRVSIIVDWEKELAGVFGAAGN